MRALAAAVWVVVTACGTAPPERLVNEATVAPPEEPVAKVLHAPRLALPRPELDVSGMMPDASEHGRWPLTSSEHPVLEPYFDVAGALAQPGISWIALCERGAQKRNLGAKQDYTRYLAAWCDVANHDVPAALYKLGQLRSSGMASLWTAAKHDAANILADHGPADDVERLLRDGALLEADVVDLTSAAYFEVGRREDALVLNGLASSIDRNAADNIVCERMARAAASADERHTDPAIARLSEFASKHVASTVCAARTAELRCWRTPMYFCAPYFATQQRSAGELALFEAYERWPQAEMGIDRWLSVAESAVEAEPVQDAVRFGVPALEAALRVSGCAADRLSAIEEHAGSLVDRTLLAPRLDGHRLAVVFDQVKHFAWLARSTSECLRELEALPSVGVVAR